MMPLITIIMTTVFLLLNLSCTHHHAPAIRTPATNLPSQVLEMALKNVRMDNGNVFYSEHEFVSPNASPKKQPITIKYIKFGISKGARGAIVISPGFTEAALKYAELAYDLNNRGFSPIFVINHRGQGSSTRLLDARADYNKGYIDNFDYFHYDLDFMIEKILKEDEHLDIDKFFLLAHSMGGAIATRYLQSHSNPFHRVILSSPMLKMVLPTSDFQAKYGTWFVCKTFVGNIGFLGGCTDYAQGGPWAPHVNTFETNPVTSDLDRFIFSEELLVNRPDLALGGPTIGWVHEALKGSKKAIQQNSIQEMVRINRVDTMGNIKDFKIKIFQAGRDTTVENSGQNEFCDQLPSRCELVTEPFLSAKHEIFMENDTIRNEALAIIDDFFK